MNVSGTGILSISRGALCHFAFFLSEIFALLLLRFLLFQGHHMNSWITDLSLSLSFLSCLDRHQIIFKKLHMGVVFWLSCTIENNQKGWTTSAGFFHEKEPTKRWMQIYLCAHSRIGQSVNAEVTRKERKGRFILVCSVFYLIFVSCLDFIWVFIWY